MLGPDAAQHALRHSLRLPFSAWLVQSALAGIAATGALPDGMRRFEIAQVMHHNEVRVYATCKRPRALAHLPSLHACGSSHRRLC